jgi:hypothetical protein
METGPSEGGGGVATLLSDNSSMSLRLLYRWEDGRDRPVERRSMEGEERESMGEERESTGEPLGLGVLNRTKVASSSRCTLLFSFLFSLCSGMRAILEEGGEEDSRSSGSTDPIVGDWSAWE